MPAISKKQVGIETRRKTTSGRFYEITPGKPYPSITNVLGVINKPALVGWAGKVEREACVEAAVKLAFDAEFESQMNDEEAYKKALIARIGKQKAAIKEIQAAAEIGTEAHALCEWYVRKMLGWSVGQEPKACDKAQWGFMAFQDWCKAHSFKPTSAEQVVFSHEQEFAGTLDLLGYVDDVLTIVDIKTGKAIYSEAKLQVAAYWGALREMGTAAQQGVVLRLPKVETDPEFEAVTISNLDWHYNRFLHALALWHWQDAEDQEYRAKTEAAS